MHSLVIDLTGQKFNKLTALEYTGSGKWKCRCDCGSEILVRGADLRSHEQKSCGCIIAVEDLTGMRFGKLVASKLIKKPDKHGRQWPYWECVCDCGNITVVLARSLKSCNTRSCGCLIGEVQRGDVKNATMAVCLQRLRKQRKSQGLCRCGNKPQPGFIVCDTCRGKSRIAQKLFRTKRLEQGLCICGRPLLEGRKHCIECLSRSLKITRNNEKTAQPSVRRYCGMLARRNRKNAHRRPYGEFSITNHQIYALWQSQDGLCALSGLPLSCELHSLESASVDRINSNLGYLIDNIQLVCRWANYAKNKHTDREFNAVLMKIRAQGAEQCLLKPSK